MNYNDVQEAAEYIRSRIDIAPAIGIILGSGLNGIADEIQGKQTIPYGEIPHFVCSTAPGHIGQFVVGTISNVPVICMQGRLHYYEGHSTKDIILPIRVMKLLGIDTLIITNASGGINLSFEVGDLMLIEDHINLTGQNPLIGQNEPEFGPRFCDMSYAYTPILREKAMSAAKRLGINLKHGVYIGCIGPSYETPAEIRAFRVLGADAVGMSTIPEVIGAAHCGLKILAISLITNMAAGVLDQPLTEEELFTIGNLKGPLLKKLIVEIISDLK